MDSQMRRKGYEDMKKLMKTRKEMTFSDLGGMLCVGFKEPKKEIKTMKTRKELEPCIHGDLGDCLDCNKPQPTVAPTASYTPTPWKLEGNWIVSGFFGVHELPASNEGSQAEHLANAAFIVRAVNSHEEMLAILKTILTMIDKTQGADRLGILIAQAIAKAEGK